ncbi:hypothetical protein BDN72DRAFT_959883 [Pluteus cervinus]|uniref:Uncharacterized protein n=1 Tax=Pluteus cervinus TaxID=181527 RepID=A0ACD3ATU6_9AGAR|nr:hypothetical protein BDN72DRAFT_959883 [Pluteus cervinus]
MEDILDLLDLDVPTRIDAQFLEIILNAKGGSIKDLSILARAYESLPNPLGSKIHLIFLRHLNSSDVPNEPKSDVVGVIEGVEEGKAFWSLWGLAQLSEALCDGETSDTDPCGQEFIEAWPGIFKWSAFFYTSRVQASSPSQGTNTTSSQKLSRRGIIRDVILGSWCSLALSESTKRVMLETHGVVDIAARLWIFEGDPDIPKVTPLRKGVPMGSFLLELFLKDGDQTASLDNIVSAVGGDIGRIAQTLLGRLKKATRSPEFKSDPVDGIFLLSFITSLCHTKPETLEVFLNHGAIPVCIKLLIGIASVINEKSYNPANRLDFTELMQMTFGFLWLSLETGLGLPWVLEAINTGLFTAFVECSPMYDELKDDKYTDMVSVIFISTIPRYLTYGTVVQAADTMLLRLEKTERFLSLRKTRAWDAFHNLAILTGWRFGVVAQVKQMKKEVTICFNTKCRKLDVRDNFRKCAKCGVALYCSKECQTVHWKAPESGHKKECREPTKAHKGLFQEDGRISTRDWEFIQTLNIYETRYNLPYLRRLAATQHPGVPLRDLAIVINYNSIPMTYHVDLCSTWVKDHPSLFTFPKNEFRPNLEVKFTTYIIGIVPHNGPANPRLYVTPFENGVWNLDRNLKTKAGRKAGVDSTGNKIIDWMGEEADARTRLYCGI